MLLCDTDIKTLGKVFYFVSLLLIVNKHRKHFPAKKTIPHTKHREENKTMILWETQEI